MDLFTYLLTPCSTVILEKLTGFQLVKKFPAFYVTRRFITAFTNARHLSLSSATSIQSMLPHPTSWRSILILSSHLCLGLSLRFPLQNPVHVSPLTHTCYIPRHLILLDLITDEFWVNNKLHTDIYIYIYIGRDSSVGIATRFGLDGPGIKSQWGRDFPHPSRPDLGPTQPPIRWVPDLSRG